MKSALMEVLTLSLVPNAMMDEVFELKRNNLTEDIDALNNFFNEFQNDWMSRVTSTLFAINNDTDVLQMLSNYIVLKYKYTWEHLTTYSNFLKNHCVFNKESLWTMIKSVFKKHQLVFNRQD